MKGLRTLLWLLMPLLGLSIFGMLLAQASPDDLGLQAFWVLAVAFMAVALWALLTTGIRQPRRLGFIHVLVLMTAVSWLAYGITALDSTAHASMEAILKTFTQNLAGLLVLIFVVESMTKTLACREAQAWTEHLVKRVSIMPTPMISVLLAIYGFFIFYQFSMGIVISGTGGVSATATALQSTLLQLKGPLSGVVTILGFIFIFGRNPSQQKLGLILMLVQMAMAFLSGRRSLLGMFLLGGLIWVGLRGLNLRRLLAISGVLVVLVAVAGPLFQRIRVDAMHSEIQSAEVASRGAMLAKSFATGLDEFTIMEAVMPDYTENVKGRASFLNWTVMIQEQLMQDWEVRGGEVALASFIEVIPRLLFPDKLELMGEFQIEQKIQIWFGMPLEDGSITVLGCAIADGGWVGVLIYFAAYGALLALLMRFMMKAHFPPFNLWAASQLFGLCFNVEMGITELTGGLRMLIILVFLDRMLKARSERRKQRVAGMVIPARDASITLHGRY